MSDTRHAGPGGSGPADQDRGDGTEDGSHRQLPWEVIERETPFSMVARSVVLGLRCGDCLRLYLYLDQRQGTRVARAVRGAQEVADQLAWQLRTAKKHLRHLADAGLVQLDPEPTRAWGNTNVRLVHQPARQPGRASRELRELPGVWEPDPDERWRPPPTPADQLDQLRANAERDAPPASARTAPPVPRAPRHIDPPHAERVAPSVPLSLRSEGWSERVGGGDGVALLVEHFPGVEVVEDGAARCHGCDAEAVAGTDWCEQCAPF